METTNYFERPEISNSDLKLIKKSIHHYLYYKQNPTEPTPAMELGTAIHSYFLEPQKFENEYAITDILDKRTKEYKAFYKANKDKKIITSEFIELVNNINSNMPPTIKELMTDEHNEFECALIFDYSDIQCRAKLDIVNHKKRLIIDLKTCDSVENLTKRIFDFEYYRQSKFYQLAVKNALNLDYDFQFIFVETKPPFGTKLVEIDYDYSEIALTEIDDLLLKYKEYQFNPSAYKFPYSEKLETISKPYWIK